MEILNAYTVYNKMLTILPIIPLVATLVFGLKTIIDLLNKQWKTVLISILIALVCFGTFNILVKWWTDSALVRYEVLITDYNKVNFDEYKIVETRGKITILEEIKSK